MIVFEISKCLRKLFGDPSSGVGCRCAYIAASIFTSTSMPASVVGALLNLVLNLNDDIQRAWPSLAPAFGLISATIIYWHLFRNHSRLYTFLDEMQDIVNESE